MIQLSDSQIVRVFELCERILKVKSEVPVPPQGFAQNVDVQIAAAKDVRQSLEALNDVLVELGALLR